MSTCENCQREFIPNRGHSAARFCSISCYHVFGRRGDRKEKVKGVRMTFRPDHPLAPPSGLVATHRIVLFEKIGPGTHSCHWCGTEITWRKGSEARMSDAIFGDHLDWNQNNNSPDNLVAACNHCNSHRLKDGTRSRIGEDEPTITLSSGAKTRAVKRTCPTCGKEFLALPAHIKKGRARFCSRTCRRWAEPKPVSHPKERKVSEKREPRQRLNGIKEGEIVFAYSNGARTRGVELICEICGATFIRPPSQIKPGKARCCSRSCARRLPRRKRPELHSE